MAIINILAFGALALLLSLKWKEKIVDVLPAAACVLILILYILAFFRRLSAIDWIGSIFLLAVLACFAARCRRPEDRAKLWKRLKQELLHPGVIVALLLFVGTAVLVRGRIATWWDDINFWATDLKAIYALDGFAAKYTNAASEFGDYPPGAQLMKWWFVHMNPDGFSEGLMFAGYYFSVFVFLMPLLGRMKGRNPALVLLSAVCLWAFPSVAEAFYCQGMCADLVMAVIYGAFLSAVMDEEGHEKSFYYMRLALYLSVLVLVKSVGFLWAAFGLVFLWIWKWKGLRDKKGAAGQCGDRLWLFGVTAAPVLSGGSWLVFCLLMRRVAKLTGAALSIAAGNLPVLLPGTRGELTAAFLEAFAVWPLHRGKTLAIDFSPLAMFMLICVLVYVFWRGKVFTKAQAKLLGIFLPVSGVIFYGINLVSHLTIFAAETQYLEPFAMVSSIERYGAPFTIGSLYVLAFFLLKKEEAAGFLKKGRLGALWRRDGAYLICFAFVILSANWQEVLYGLYGYRAEREEALDARAEMITEESAEFLNMVSGLDAGSGMRILYMKDAAVSQWVKNAYVAYEAAPVSLIFGSVDCETMNSGDMWNAMDASHAGYLYLDEISGNVEELFSPFAEGIGAHVLYRIRNENGQISLEEFAAEGEKTEPPVEQPDAGGADEAERGQPDEGGKDEAEPGQAAAGEPDFGTEQDVPQEGHDADSYLEKGGQIALVTDPGVPEDKAFNREALEGALTYADAADIPCSRYSAENDSEEECVKAIESAVSDGAKIVICTGARFEQAVGSLQEKYSDISFLLLDGVVRDKAGKETDIADNVHCIVYREEEAGYLAGYLAVLEGYRKLGFVGGKEEPSVQRYGYGYLQGIDAAAKLLEVENDIRVDYWYAGTFSADEKIKEVSSGWYRDGTEIIFACGGLLDQSVLAAAEECGGMLIGADADQSGRSELFLTSVLKGIRASVIASLDEFFASGAVWPQELAGRVTCGGSDKKYVGLPVTEEAWRFKNVSVSDYFSLLGALRDGRIEVSGDISAHPGTDVPVVYHNG